MNKRGQALVEFILVIPVLIMILFSIIDFGNIYYHKILLEGKFDQVIEMYRANKTFNDILTNLQKEDTQISFQITNQNNQFLDFKISQKLKLITPGLELILGQPFKIEVNRVVPYE